MIPIKVAHLESGINDFCQCQTVTMETTAANYSCVCPGSDRSIIQILNVCMVKIDIK